MLQRTIRVLPEDLARCACRSGPRICKSAYLRILITARRIQHESHPAGHRRADQPHQHQQVRAVAVPSGHRQPLGQVRAVRHQRLQDPRDRGHAQHHADRWHYGPFAGGGQPARTGDSGVGPALHRRLQASDGPEHHAGDRIRAHHPGICGRVGGRHRAPGLEAGAVGRDQRRSRQAGDQHRPPGWQHRRVPPGPGAGRGGDPANDLAF